MPAVSLILMTIKMEVGVIIMLLLLCRHCWQLHTCWSL